MKLGTEVKSSIKLVLEKNIYFSSVTLDTNFVFFLKLMFTSDFIFTIIRTEQIHFQSFNKLKNNTHFLCK